MQTAAAGSLGHLNVRGVGLARAHPPRRARRNELIEGAVPDLETPMRPSREARCTPAWLSVDTTRGAHVL